MTCPDDDILLALLEGRLDGVSLAAIDLHLDGCESCQDVVATLASGVVAREPSTESTPSRLGRFELREPLGEGAMGTVHVAYDPELDREIAVKRLRTRDDATQRARLLREAQALARLSHPNVVTVFDVGVEGETLYLAMELVRGTSLRPWMNKPHDANEALTTLLPAGRGLAAAHARGIVHRDFKPENVLIGDDGRVKVVDFGLAHEDAGPALEDASLEESTIAHVGTLTATGALIGTPAYMAPEQIDRALHRDPKARDPRAGDPEAQRVTVDARADQFAYAVTLWEALEGARPFAGAQRILELRAKIEAGPAPSRRMSRAMERSLRRALAPQPSARFEDMNALLAAITPRDARPAWLAAGAIGVGVLGAALVGAGLFADPGEACRASEHAVELYLDDARLSHITEGLRPALARWATRWTEARVDACEGTHVRHDQSEALLDARVSCLDHQAGRVVAIADALASSTAAAPELLDALPDPERCGGSLAVEAADTAGSREARERQDRATIALAGGDATAALEALGQDVVGLPAPLRIEASILRASALRAEARYDDALGAARAALFLAEDERDASAASRAWLEVLRVLGASGRYTEASDFLTHAEAARERGPRLAEDDEAFLRVRATIHIGLGELAAARVDLDDAARAIDARQGPRSLEGAVIHASLGNLARLEARLDDALTEHETALEIDREILGEEHPRVGRDLHNVAGILRRLGRLDEASERYEQALTIAVRSLGAHHPEAALTRNSLGLVAFDRHDLARARALWEEALPDLLEHDHGDAALVHHNLALLELEESHPDRALLQIREALAIDRRRVGVEAKRVASEDLVLGRALAALGRTSEAREALLRTLESAETLHEVELEHEARAELARLDAAALAAGDEPSPQPPRVAPRTTAATQRMLIEAAGTDVPLEARRTIAPTVEATPEPTVAPTTTVEAPDAAVAPRAAGTSHPAGSGAYGARVPWE